LQRDGLINAALVSLGLERIVFFLNANWAIFWVIFISIWAQMGFYTLILLAGLQSIPRDMYEAADMDGANRWQSFRGITLPLLMPTLLVVLVLSVIRAVQVFDQVWVLTGGGPGTCHRLRRAVYLRDSIRQPDSAIRHGVGRICGAGQ
jgi:alpha-1,4-digalacturonate transport system permease protein